MGSAANKKLRQTKLQSLLAKNPFLTDENLAEQFEVSIQTIRLDRLALGIPELRERTRFMAENAQKNHIPAEDYETHFGNILTDEALADEIDGKYDIITANIVADVLIAMKEHFLRYITDGGFLIVSGIIEERMEEVLSAIEACGFTRLDVNVKEGWAAALFTK